MSDEIKNTESEEQVAAPAEAAEEKAAPAETVAAPTAAPAQREYRPREDGPRGPRHEGGRRPRFKDDGDDRDDERSEMAPRAPRFRKKVCRFCHDKNAVIDYKRSDILEDFITDRGKILPRRITGTCAKHQRAIAKEIKVARIIALLPYVEK